MNKGLFEPIADTFRASVDSVFRLAEFDHLVLDVAIGALERIQERATADGIGNYRLSVTNGLQQLRSIREHDSLRPQYAHIFNQCVVLLVSYFGAAISDIFGACLSAKLERNPSESLLHEELRLTVGELVEMGEGVKEGLGSLFMRKKDISFQDMQSIARAFETYCGHSPDKDANVNNIITGQACRHVIVHAGSIVSEQFVKQVSRATPRTLKLDLQKGQKVQFTIPELKMLSESMLAYVGKLVDDLEEVVGEDKT